METKKLLNQKVDIFKPIKDKDGYYYSYTTSIIDFFTNVTNQNKYKVEYLRKINLEDEVKAKKYKKDELVGATISATFNKRRVTGDVKEKTGIIVIDIDKGNNPDLDVNKAKQDVMKLPYVFFTSLSCRGEGIFCLVHYDKEKYIGYIFNALKNKFKEIGYIIDKQCGDITRLRIVSWDNNILVKNNVEMFDEILVEEQEPYEVDEDWVLTKQDLKDIVVCVYVLVKYNKYTSNDYNEWLLDGFRLATIPNKEVGLKLFTIISEYSDNFKSYEDVREKFSECRRTTTYKTNILGYYINKIKEIYGPDWRFRVNDLLKT